MKTADRIHAAAEILEVFSVRDISIKKALNGWGRQNPRAGARDRAWISGLCLDALRHRNSLTAITGNSSGRALVSGVLTRLWGVPPAAADAFFTQASGYSRPEGEERTESRMPPLQKDAVSGSTAICADNSSMRNTHTDPEENLHVRGNFPRWMTPHIKRVFGSNAAAIMEAFSTRADIDLRINTLKVRPEKALKTLESVNARPVPFLETAVRIPAPDPSRRAPVLSAIPAYSRGWFEVQDFGSQLAACAAGNIKGAQVLDYCAGAGGKTLALAALMENTGQIHAYDRDRRRLKPLACRARRAGVRNLRICDMPGKDCISDLADRMDVVFVDAPCTGTGVWRRQPDTKWRLTARQLERRMNDQDTVLEQAARFVKPGGHLVWVTCSFLMEENEDRLDAFLEGHAAFLRIPVYDMLHASSGFIQGEKSLPGSWRASGGAIRLTPGIYPADGFYVAILQRQK